MKTASKKSQKAKPWGSIRIPIAPPGSRHGSTKDYKRPQQSVIDTEWWDEMEAWEKNLPIEGEF